MNRPIDYLRILKDHSRPLIELLRDGTCLNVQVRDELDSLLPDRWLATHPDARLEINRSVRLVGQEVA